MTMPFTLQRSTSDVAAQGRISRRSLLGIAGVLGAGAPLALLEGARALTLFGASLPETFGDFPICRTAATGEAAGGPPRRLTIAWNASSICTTAAPVAKERGIFLRNNLDVDFINYGGSTEQLLEAIATGKADAGIGMALRWLKPLEQGFDVRITAGVHGGCIRLLGSKSAKIETLESLRGKAIGISDQASPAKNFVSIALMKQGIDPIKDVEWRQYPMEVLPLAVDKGEVAAIADNDPRTYLWLKTGNLNEVLTNLVGEFGERVCCLLVVRGKLVREERAVAAALTRSILEAGDLVSRNPTDAAAVYAGYGGRGSLDDLAAMLRSHTHHHHPVGAALKKQITLYTDELKLVHVIKPSTDSAKFAERIFTDVLS
jgi:NitT/TauT family transport system substrate-binding protein